MRLGLLGDVHPAAPPTARRWINPYEPEHLDRLLDEALSWFGEADTDLLLVLGDMTETGDGARPGLRPRRRAVAVGRDR